MNQSNRRLPDSKAANRMIAIKKRNVRNRAAASRAEANKVANKAASKVADDKPCIVN
jgi:hypothetical protein